MSFVWTDYLDLAKHLAATAEASANPEAWYRSAVSRAYYAALLTARHLLRDEWGIEVPETAEIHGWIPGWFLAEDALDRREIGARLERLRDRRRRADYEDEIRNVAAIAVVTLADAGAVISSISTL